MKNKTGKIIGFVVGTAGFLWMFKLIILDNTPPSDELAPGIVVITAVVAGVISAFAGSLIQNYLGKKNYK